jgi:chromate transporter
VPTFREALRFWLKLGFINFGGPAGQIAIMHRELVEHRRWIGEQPFLRALNFCMILPGPEAQQLATYIGWRMHGLRGGLAAGVLFVLPSVFVLLLLSWLAAAHGDAPVVAGLFYGIQPVVVALVAEAVLRIGRRAFHHRALYAFALGAFVALYFFRVPFPAVIAAAALLGLLLDRRWPQVFEPPRSTGSQPVRSSPPTAAQDQEELSASPFPSLTRALRIWALYLLLWAAPVGALWLWRGRDDVLTAVALFFTKAAFVTFGGAYAVLSYISDVAVNHYHWLNAQQMVSGLGLAESTPGPLIMVTQYVGFFAGWNNPGALPQQSLGLAVSAAFLTTYVTFLPCFFFIFAFAPYVEVLAANRYVRAAFTAVTAAVVGVIANLGVFFASRILFPIGEQLPALDRFASTLALVSFVVLWRTRLPMHVVLLAGALLGLLWKLGLAS